MTRETKIGLLVGLAFIIVIGILLSDHMATTTEPTSAALNDAQANNRSAIVVPNENIRGATLPNNITPREITPNNTIPTRNETVVRGPVVGDISVSGPLNNGNTPRGNDAMSVTGPGDAVAGNDPGSTPTQPENNNTTTTPGGNAGIDPSLQALAQQHGAELEIPGGRTQGNAREPQPRENTQAQRPANTQKTYTVEAGDTLGRIASKTMGSNSKANRDAIVKANPSMQGNPDKVVLGATYVIPTPTAPANTTTNNSTAVLPLKPITPPTNTREARETSRDNANTITYTVKSGDTLIAIAREKLGSPRATTTIKDLNKDVLKGGDALRIGMRLKLPAKPVASAN